MLQYKKKTFLRADSLRNPQQRYAELHMRVRAFHLPAVLINTGALTCSGRSILTFLKKFGIIYIENKKGIGNL